MSAARWYDRLSVASVVMLLVGYVAIIVDMVAASWR